MKWENERITWGVRLPRYAGVYKKSSQKEVVIDLAQPPGGVGLQKGRFASQFQEIGNSGIEINPENDVQREEDQLSEMGDGAPFGSEIIPNEELCPKIEESIIRP